MTTLDDNTITAAVSRAMRELSDGSNYADRITELDPATIGEMAALHGLLGQLSDATESLLKTNEEYARCAHICVMAIAGLVMLEKVASNPTAMN